MPPSCYNPPQDELALVLQSHGSLSCYAQVGPAGIQEDFGHLLMRSVAILCSHDPHDALAEALSDQSVVVSSWHAGTTPIFKKCSGGFGWEWCSILQLPTNSESRAELLFAWLRSWDATPRVARRMSPNSKSLAHRNRSDFRDLRLRCPSRTPEIAGISERRESNAELRFKGAMESR